MEHSHKTGLSPICKIQLIHCDLVGFFLSLPLFCSAFSIRRIWMKRESGENPGQSRCCEFRGGCISTNATILEERMGRRCTGNKSEDLQNKVCREV